MALLGRNTAALSRENRTRNVKHFTNWLGISGRHNPIWRICRLRTWTGRPESLLLDHSLRSVVACQRKAAKEKHIPWGISESAYSKKDSAGHYQYHAFGLRTLALRPSMHRGLVVSPYASFLALTVDPASVLENLRVMKQMGWQGPLGYYEAADFSPSRVQKSGDYELVRCWMAHHQGMILLSVCNLLAGCAMQNLFHAEPMVAATELLLHERLPRTIHLDHVRRTAFGNLRKSAEHQSPLLAKGVETGSQRSEDETECS